MSEDKNIIKEVDSLVDPSLPQNLPNKPVKIPEPKGNNKIAKYYESLYL